MKRSVILCMEIRR